MIQFFGELGLFIFKGPDDSYVNIIRILVLYIITIVILLILRYGSKNISKYDFSTSLGVMALLIIFGVSMVALLNKAQNT
jgi:high-affinity Fe2+/Pb2+ permease